jgi:ribosomal protein S18 acetylase RimI-like enzyme
MTVTIRSLLPEEAEAAAAIQVAPGTPWHQHGYDASQAYATVKAGLSTGARILAAEIDDLAGWIWFDTKGTFFHSAYIRILAVSARHRHAGVGTALLAAAESEMFAATYNAFLLVSESNQVARAFYAKHGYQNVGRLEDYVRVGSTELVYWKSTGTVEGVPHIPDALDPLSRERNR